MPNVNATRQQHNRRQSLPLQGLFFILLLIVGVYSLLSSSFFALEKIEVRGAKQLEPLAVIGLSQVSLGTNIFKIKIGEVESNLSKHPLIKKVGASRALPRKLLIDIQERVGVGLLPKENGFLIVDDEGVVLNSVASIEKTNLPIITGVKLAQLKVGEKVKAPQLEPALCYLTVIPPEISAILSEINCADSENIMMYTIDGIEIRVGNTDRAAEKIRIYSEVIAQKYQERIQYIDLSYESKPVVKFLTEAE